MKLIKLFLGTAGALLMVACSSAPVQTSPDDSNWRLRNFLDNGLAETIRVYNFCYQGKPTGFVAARDFEEGSHSIVARITQDFNNIGSKSLDAYTTLNGDFEGGKTYVFQNVVEGDEATIWIADIETGEAVTPKEIVKLTIPDVVDNEQYQSRRCRASTL